MAREVVRQNDFSYGELSLDNAASGNLAAVKASLKKGQNVRIRNSYGFSQRFGSHFLNTLSPGIEATVVTSDDQTFIAHIRAGGVDFCDGGGNIVFSLSGAPWSADQIPGIVWHVRKDELYIAHNAFWPQLVSYSAGSWSVARYAFDDGVGGSKDQLYYRFAPKDVTMRPSATSGNITLAFSANVLLPGHAGVRFRYVGKEVLITAVLSGSTANATVIDQLPPTQRVRVKDASGYRLGEAVEGEDTGTQGFIVGIDLANQYVYSVITNGYEGFSGDGEKLISPDHFSQIGNDSGLFVAPAAFTVWDEQVFSDARGYPGDVFEHASRLGFADFPGIPDAIALSAPGDVGGFNIGTGQPGDAIFEKIGQSLGQRVRYCVSAANLIILTDQRVYYVPESPDTPLSAATFEFLEVGPAGSSSAYPANVEEGVVYVESGGNRVMGLLSTGNISAPWDLHDLSRHAPQVIVSPVAVAMTNGNAQAPERYIFVLNSDGSMAVLFFDAEQPRIGWTPWVTNGEWVAMTVRLGEIFTLCARTIQAEQVYFLEKFDSDCQLDASVLLSDLSSAPIQDSAGAGLLDDTGDALLGGNAAVFYLAGETVAALNGTEYLGTFAVGVDGSVDLGGVTEGDFEIGFHFDMDAVLWTPEPEGDERPQFDRQRIARASVRTQDTGVFALGIAETGKSYLRPAYDQGDNFDAAPPLRSEVRRFNLPGWQFEPCVEITRPVPHPVHILSVAQEVAF